MFNHLKIPHVPKKQLENVIYWTAKKENPIDEKEVVFDYEMQGEITDQGIPKYSVMVYSAPRSEVEKVRDLFSIDRCSSCRYHHCAVCHSKYFPDKMD